MFSTMGHKHCMKEAVYGGMKGTFNEDVISFQFYLNLLGYFYEKTTKFQLDTNI